jgi:hypothetical protein
VKVMSLGRSEAMLIYFFQQSVFMLSSSLRQPLLSPTYYLIKPTSTNIMLCFQLDTCSMEMGSFPETEICQEKLTNIQIDRELGDERSNEHIPPTVLAYKLAPESRHLAASIPATSLILRKLSSLDNYTKQRLRLLCIFGDGLLRGRR